VTKSTAIALGALLVVVVGGLGALAEEQPLISPQSLVGEWVGYWEARSTGGAARRTGPYRLTIRRVAGSKIFGHLEVVSRHQAEFDIVGTLDGSSLTYGRTQLIIYDRGDSMEMRGSTEGGGPSGGGSGIPRAITLYKKK
jgi:hypothetical protein